MTTLSQNSDVHNQQNANAPKPMMTDSDFASSNIHVAIPDTYIDGHPTWSFEKICYEYRERLFKAYRRAGIVFHAITVSSIESLEDRNLAGVNPKYGLKLHVAGIMMHYDRPKFSALLEAQCLEIHKQAHAVYGLPASKSLGAVMQDPNGGTAIYVKWSEDEFKVLDHQYHCHDMNCLNYLKNALQRNLDLERVGMSFIHGANYLQGETTKLKNKRRRILQKLRMIHPFSTILSGYRAEAKVVLADVIAEHNCNSAESIVVPMELHHLESAYHKLIERFTKYSPQLGSKYYPVVTWQRRPEAPAG